MAEIIQFPGNTSEFIAPKIVLEGAIAENLKNVVVVGTCQDGSLFAAGSTGHVSDVLYIMERAKLFLMDLVEESGCHP